MTRTCHGVVPGSGSSTPVLEVRDLSKSFGPTRALRSATLELSPGEVHALFGGNGSGKSTLIKILAGVHHADSGVIRVGETALPAERWSLDAARRAGLRFTHQDPALFPSLSVAENLFAGSQLPRGFGGRVRWSEVHDRAASWLRSYELRIDPRTEVRMLRPADQALVSIVRAVRSDLGSPSVVFLDEPTAALPEHEVSLLFDALRQFVAMGTAIVYVTHRFGEIRALADRITVLRDGQTIKTMQADSTSRAEVAELISPGGPAHPNPGSRAVERTASKDPLLSLDSVCAGPLRDVSFQLRPGEVVGVAGLLGSGRTSLLHAIYGVLRLDAGSMVWEGNPWIPASPNRAMASGVAFLPETRSQFGYFDGSVKSNILAGDLGRHWAHGRFSVRAEDATAQQAIREYGIKTHSSRASLTSLSGGNQQKVLLARCLLQDPRLLLLDEPTQGVDIGARAEIWDLLAERTGAGLAVLVATSDPEELLEHTDRLLVLNRGVLVADVGTRDIGRSHLTELMWSTYTEVTTR